VVEHHPAHDQQGQEGTNARHQPRYVVQLHGGGGGRNRAVVCGGGAVVGCNK
jgi:hypothetical protein